MKESILQEPFNEQLMDELQKANINLLKKDFSLIDKKIFLYNVDELTAVSKVAIIVDDFICINVDLFEHVNNKNPNTIMHQHDLDTLRLKVLEDLTQGNLDGVVQISTKDFLKLLEDNQYNNSIEIFKYFVNPEEQYFNDKKNEKKILTEFIDKKFPELVHEFNKSKNMQPILDFLKSEEKNIDNLSYLGYGLFISQFSQNSMLGKFGVSFTNENRKEIALCVGAFKDFDNMKRLILVNEISGMNDFKVGINQNTFKPKMK